jgi:hypothetical protein
MGQATHERAGLMSCHIETGGGRLFLPLTKGGQELEFFFSWDFINTIFIATGH